MNTATEAERTLASPVCPLIGHNVHVEVSYGGCSSERLVDFYYVNVARVAGRVELRLL